jgi:hypothetical protein
MWIYCTEVAINFNVSFTKSCFLRGGFVAQEIGSAWNFFYPGFGFHINPNPYHLLFLLKTARRKILDVTEYSECLF